MSLPTSVLAALMAAGASNEAILAACRANDEVKRLEQLTHLYLVEVVGDYKPHPIKIGISSNIEQRLLQLKSMQIFAPKLLGYFTFDSREEARRIEMAMRDQFSPCPKFGKFSKEILATTLDESLEFLTPRVGSRPFNHADRS